MFAFFGSIIKDNLSSFFVQSLLYNDTYLFFYAIKAPETLIKRAISRKITIAVYFIFFFTFIRALSGVKVGKAGTGETKKDYFLLKTIRQIEHRVLFFFLLMSPATSQK